LHRKPDLFFRARERPSARPKVARLITFLMMAQGQKPAHHDITGRKKVWPTASLSCAAFPALFLGFFDLFLPFQLVGIHMADRFFAHAVPADDLTLVLLAAFAAHWLVANAAFPHGIVPRVQITFRNHYFPLTAGT
jgi:hypothetical protein